MPQSSTWVVKLGGAMMGAPELAPWVEACLSGAGEVRCAVVVGGGAFANHVRELDARWSLGEALGHALALDAMRLNARVVEAIAAGVPVRDDPEALARALADGADGLWSPPRPFEVEALPATWSATSDSIALWLARTIGADGLLLVKSTPGEALADGAVRRLQAADVVDGHFGELLDDEAPEVRVVTRSEHAAFARGRVQAPPSLPGTRVH